MAFALYEMKIILPRLFRRVGLRLEAPLPRVAPKVFLLGPEKPIRVTVEPLRAVSVAPPTNGVAQA